MDLLREAQQLKNVPMFARLDAPKLKLLAFTSQRLSFDAGEELFHLGDAADCAYVIVEGEVDVLADIDAGEIVVTTLGKNQLCGEMAVLSNYPRSATVRAKGRVQALRISDEAFLRLLSENPEVALDVMRQLSDKIAQSQRQFEELQDRLQRLEAKMAGNGHDQG